MAYAADPEKLRAFYERYDECRKEIDALKSEYIYIIFRN